MNPIVLTDAALLHLDNSLKKRGSGVGLRIGIKTTGCSGLSYVVDIAEEIQPGDHVFKQPNGAKVLVDAKAYPFIQGLQVDFVRSGLNQGFKFTNPNAMGTCGCGESFSVETSKEMK